MNYPMYKFTLFKNGEIHSTVKRECATDEEIENYVKYLSNKYNTDKIVVQMEVVKWEFVKEFYN